MGGQLPRPLLDDGYGVQDLHEMGETTGRRPRLWWVMAVGFVVRGMTACLTVAAAVVVVVMLPLVVAVAVDGVALSLLRSFIRLYGRPSACQAPTWP